jgi:UDP-N-acetylmuramate-alanine ligase
VSFFRRFFCSHHWEVQVSTTVKPTHPNKLKDWNYRDEEFKELTQGVSRVLLTCSDCGSIEERQILGVPEDKLDAVG